MRVLRSLWIPDSHVPNEHGPSFELMLKAGRFLKPDLVVIGGDFADFDSLSAHEPNTVEGKATLKSEVRAVKRRLRQVEALGAATNLFILGNHEWRLERFIARQAPALTGVIDVDSLLGLTEAGWVVCPYRKTAKVGKLNVTHDTGHAGINAHRQSATDHLGSTVIFHTHRMAYEVKGRMGGTPYLATMLGWLGDPEKIDYVHQVKASHWVHGFGVGYHMPNGIVHMQPVPIIEGACFVGGKLIR